MAINCSILPAPTGCTATLQAGGSLAANTTYYYVVVAYETTYYTPATSAVIGNHSPTSIEGSFTTDNINKSVKINWANVAGATRYQIFLSTTSNTYYASRGQDTITTDAVGAISNGVTGYVISSIVATSANPYIIHSCQLKNSLYQNINKNLGIIKVNIDGTESITLDTIYAAIIAQGYSNYVYYDGYLFVLKGYIIVEDTIIDAGSLVIENKCIVFLHGGMINRSPNYSIRIGRLLTGTNIADPKYSANIDICNARYAFCNTSTNANGLQVYGANLTINRSQVLTVAETLVVTYYLGVVGGLLSLAFNISAFKEVNSAIPFRFTTSNASDIKYYQLNNYDNNYHTRLDIIDGNVGYYALLPYSSTPAGFYNCKWHSYPAYLRWYATTTTYDNHKCDFYDNEFVGFANNEPVIKYTNMTSTHYATNQTAYFKNSLAFTIQDENGNAISGATITVKNKDNNITNIYEHDSTENRWVTGKVYTAITTSSDGTSDFYVDSYNVKLNPNNTTYPTSIDTISTYNYPLTIEVSKEGYETNTIIINEIKSRQTLLLTLLYTRPDVIYYQQAISGNITSTSISGSIEVIDVNGSLNSTTISGNIENNEITGTIENNKISGNL